MSVDPTDDGRHDIPAARAIHHTERALRGLRERTDLDDMVLVHGELRAALRHVEVAIARAALEEVRRA